jgi:hypothetical protein
MFCSTLFYVYVLNKLGKLSGNNSGYRPLHNIPVVKILNLVQWQLHTFSMN